MLNQNCMEDNIFTYRSKKYGRMIGWTINCVYCNKFKESCLPIVAESQLEKIRNKGNPKDKNLCQLQI